MLLFTLIFFVISKYLYAETEYTENKIDFSLAVLDVFNEIYDLEEWQESAESAEAFLNYLEINNTSSSNLITAYEFTADIFQQYAYDSSRRDAFVRSSYFFNKAFNLAEKEYGDNSEIFLSNLYEAALSYLETNEIKKAETLSNKWREILIKYDTDFVNYYFLKGEISLKINKYDDALFYFKKYVNLKSKVINKDKIRYGLALHKIAISSHGLKLFNDAISYNKKAVEFFKDNDYFIIGDVYRSLAHIYTDLVMIDEVEATYLEAILHYEKTLPDTDYEWLSARDDLADFYYQNENYDESLVISYNILNYYG